mmetsp:Transcript_40451/g.72648  ORF Transcript_40451/g.72648 Transcript_40451/m.72648 type:complete len:205 (-) Transcript_40451:1265-1879(-)
MTAPPVPHSQLSLVVSDPCRTWSWATSPTSKSAHHRSAPPLLTCGHLSPMLPPRLWPVLATFSTLPTPRFCGVWTGPRSTAASTTSCAGPTTSSTFTRTVLAVPRMKRSRRRRTSSTTATPCCLLTCTPTRASSLPSPRRFSPMTWAVFPLTMQASFCCRPGTALFPLSTLATATFWCLCWVTEWSSTLMQNLTDRRFGPRRTP